MRGEIRTRRRLGDDGEWVLEDEYLIDGRVVTREEWEEAHPQGEGTVYLQTGIGYAKPLKSDALAVHSKQRAAVMARNAKHGLHIDYDAQGRPVFTDAGQRKRLMKIEGVRQQNSFYGY